MFNTLKIALRTINKPNIISLRKYFAGFRVYPYLPYQGSLYFVKTENGYFSVVPSEYHPDSYKYAYFFLVHSFHSS